MRMGSVQANKEESSFEKTGGKANSRHEGRKAGHGRRMLDTAVGQCGHVSLSGRHARAAECEHWCEHSGGRHAGYTK